MRPIEDWADRKYKKHGSHAHIVPFGQPYSLCGAQPFNFKDDWYGSGSMDEVDRARALPLCRDCAEALK